MVRNFAFLLMGLGFGLRFWDAQPEASLRYAALGSDTAWVGVALFYAIPLVLSYVLARTWCRWREGAWWVTGTFIASVGLTAYTLPVHLSCPLFGFCGTGNAFWMAATAFLPSAVGKALVLTRVLGKGCEPRRSLTRDVATQLDKVRTPRGAIGSLILVLICCLCVYLDQPVAPQLSLQDLRYTVGGICAGMTQSQVQARAGVGTPEAAIAPDLEPRCFRYSWGELLYTEEGWVAWVHGSPLMVDGKAVVHQGDSVETVVDVLGRPGRRDALDRTTCLVWPSRTLSIQFLDGRVQFCTLHLRQQAGSRAARVMEGLRSTIWF